jgi:hypothetical protein
MATVKIQAGGVVLKNGNVSCECCSTEVCAGVSKIEFVDNIGPDDTIPCQDFRTHKTNKVPKTGLYVCEGYIDDLGTITWSGGSYYSPPLQQQCYGPMPFSFNAFLTKGEILTCEAGSWAGNVGCVFTCCPVEESSGEGVGLSLL